MLSQQLIFWAVRNLGKKRPPEYTAEEGHEVAGTRAWDRRKQGAGRVQ